MRDRPRELEPAVPAGGPRTRKRRLGRRLRELRRRSGLTAEEAGHRAGVSKATVSRYERARGNVRWNQVEALCRAYDASDHERANLVHLAQTSAGTSGWWPYDDKLTDPMQLFLELEYEAARISHYSLGVMPGLLQTLDYARAIQPTPGEALPEDEVESYLATRMRRSEQVLDRTDPPVFDVVLDEAVIRRATGGPDVMAAQLDHLLERGQESTTSIQILPFAAGTFSAALSNFIIYGSPDPELDVVYIENPAGSLFLEDAPAREKYASMISLLRQEALAPEPSAELIAEARKMHLRHRN